jgi:hypothetical protein
MGVCVCVGGGGIRDWPGEGPAAPEQTRFPAWLTVEVGMQHAQLNTAPCGSTANHWPLRVEMPVWVWAVLERRA